MKIILNGQIKEFADAPKLGSIINQFHKDKNPIVAELNGNIIKSSLWGETPVHEGDAIELVSFVGGGSN